jgi:hypothetical protein
MNNICLKIPTASWSRTSTSIPKAVPPDDSISATVRFLMAVPSFVYVILACGSMTSTGFWCLACRKIDLPWGPPDPNPKRMPAYWKVNPRSAAHSFSDDQAGEHQKTDHFPP